MIRLIMLLGVIYVASRIVKSLFLPHSDAEEERADDLMVKDPCCNLYIPQREGIYLRRGGEDLYFCSTRCRDRYVALKEKT